MTGTVVGDVAYRGLGGLSGLLSLLLLVCSCSECGLSPAAPPAADGGQDASAQALPSDPASGAAVGEPDATAGESDDAATPSVVATDTSGHKPDDKVVIVWAPDFEVTLADYELALARLSVLSDRPEPEIPEVMLKSRRFVQSTVRELVELRVVARLVKEHNIPVTDAEIEEVIRQDEGFHQLTTSKEGRARLAKRGLTTEDVWAMAWDRVASQKLASALAGRVSEAELKELWRRQQERVVLEYVRISNTPTAARIDELVAEEPGRIERYYEDHPREFAVPKTRTILTVSSRKVARARLEEAARRIADGEDRREVERAIGGITLTERTVVPRQLPAAFRLDINSVGSDKRDRPFVVLKEEPPGQRPLSSGVRREIAAKLLREGGVLPETLALTREVVAAMKARQTDNGRSLQALLDEHHLTVAETLPFDASDDEAFIGGVGRSKSMVKTAASLKVGEVADDAVVHQHQVYVVALKKRGKADMSLFDGVKKYVEDKELVVRKRKAMRAAIQAELTKGSGVRFVLEPIFARYGRLEKAQR